MSSAGQTPPWARYATSSGAARQHARLCEDVVEGQAFPYARSLNGGSNTPVSGPTRPSAREARSRLDLDLLANGMCRDQQDQNPQQESLGNFVRVRRPTRGKKTRRPELITVSLI